MNIRLVLTSILAVRSRATDLLEGTWVSKSRMVSTGATFFDFQKELLLEPNLPGISYSFDGEGHWEEAIYQVNSNAMNHSCASAKLLWQHGSYQIKGDGSLVLTPLEVDGRQLVSEPCFDGGISSYKRYSQVEKMREFRIEFDEYLQQLRLTLFEHDGRPKQPLYLQHKPAIMLPVYVLNPKKN